MIKKQKKATYRMKRLVSRVYKELLEDNKKQTQLDINNVNISISYLYI